MSYRLFKHKTKTNKWLVVRKESDIQDNYFPVYEVHHLENGDTKYVEILHGR